MIIFFKYKITQIDIKVSKHFFSISIFFCLWIDNKHVFTSIDLLNILVPD